MNKNQRTQINYKLVKINKNWKKFNRDNKRRFNKCLNMKESNKRFVKEMNQNNDNYKRDNI